MDTLVLAEVEEVAIARHDQLLARLCAVSVKQLINELFALAFGQAVPIQTSLRAESTRPLVPAVHQALKSIKVRN